MHFAPNHWLKKCEAGQHTLLHTWCASLLFTAACLLSPLSYATAAAAFVCFSRVTSLPFAPIVSSCLLPLQLPLVHYICGSHRSCLVSAAAVLVAVIPASSPLVAAAICYPSSPFPRVRFCCGSSPLSLWSLVFRCPPEHCSPRSVDDAPHHVTFLQYFLGNNFSWISILLMQYGYCAIWIFFF